MNAGPHHPRLLEMEALARQQQFLREAARDRLLGQARMRRPRLPAPAPGPAHSALAWIHRVGPLVRRAFGPLLRGGGRPRAPGPDPEYQAG